MLARVMLAWFSIGSNDADTWPKFATLIDIHGLFYVYDRSAVMNQPPLAVLGWVAVQRVSDATGASYAFVYKLPSILADGRLLSAARLDLVATRWPARRAWSAPFSDPRDREGAGRFGDWRSRCGLKQHERDAEERLCHHGRLACACSDDDAAPLIRIS